MLAHSGVSIRSYALCISKTSKEELGMILLQKKVIQDVNIFRRYTSQNIHEH